MIPPAMALTLIIFGTDAAKIEQIERSLRGRIGFEFAVGNGPAVTAAKRLDAMWAAPMMGVEIFDVGPPFPVHQARVRSTPERWRRRGLPRYVVAGGAAGPGDPATPEHNLALVLRTLSRAVADFNKGTSDPIERIGILSEDLDILRIAPEKRADLVRQALPDDGPVWKLTGSRPRLERAARRKSR